MVRRGTILVRVSDVSEHPVDVDTGELNVPKNVG